MSSHNSFSGLLRPHSLVFSGEGSGQSLIGTPNKTSFSVRRVRMRGMRCLWVVYFTTITQYGILQGVSSSNVWVIRTYVASNNRTSPLMNIFSNAYPWQRLCIFLLVDRIGPFPKSVNEHNMMSPFTVRLHISIKFSRT